MISTYRRLQRRRRAGEIDGFTLIELLIVIVVLGILAAVVIFALGGITGKSQLAACQSDGATVSTAIAAFHASDPGVTASSALLLTDTSNGAGSKYIQSWPSASSYAYSLSATVDGGTNGVLMVAKVKNSAVVSGTWVQYNGPTSCTNAAGPDL